jgi:aryl-alcohol dehydrogenase-like predicted oxidoreductase
MTIRKESAVMEYRVLGTTGVRVSTFCLGTMMFGKWGNKDHAEGVRAIRAAIDAGINFVDTADVYSLGECEEIVGEALEGRRDQVVLATKVHGRMGEGVNDEGNSRLWIMKEVEASLRRLRTDHIDLYQMHRPEEITRIDETLSALTDLIRQGKVRYVGSSTFPASQIVEAQWAAERRNLERFVCEQPPYSILVRGIEADVLPVTQAYGIGVIVWSPLAGGWLSGKYRRDVEPDPQWRPVRTKERNAAVAARYDPTKEANQRKFEVVEALGKLASEAGLSLTHMAIAFTLAHPGVTSAIIGPRTEDQLADLLKGADVVLSEDTLDAIDAIVPPGTVLEEADRGWENPALAASARRR